MINTTRRAAALVGAATILVISAPVAHADDPNYPPSTPGPTVSGVEVSNTVAPAAGQTVAGTSASQAGGLPRTGADILAWSLAGSALVLGGGALVLVARRRGEHA